MPRAPFTLGMAVLAAAAALGAPRLGPFPEEGATEEGATNAAAEARAPSPSADVARESGVSVAVVLDLSCSMSAPVKARRAQLAAAQLAGDLRMGDGFAVVGFRDHSEVILSIDDEVYPLDVQRRLENLYPGGGSNLYAGLIRASYEVQRRSGRQHLIVLTDSPPNTGVTEQAYLLDAVRRLRASGLTISVVDLDERDPELAALAEAGGGRYTSLGGDVDRGLEGLYELM